MHFLCFSIGKPDHMHAKNVWFHATGLGNKNEEQDENPKKWKMRTLGTLIKELGHDNVSLVNTHTSLVLL